VEAADFDPPSTPAYLAGNQHVLLRHNQTFSVFVQPELQASELQAAELLPVEAAPGREAALPAAPGREAALPAAPGREAVASSREA
jgi:hypothetical protein